LAIFVDTGFGGAVTLGGVVLVGVEVVDVLPDVFPPDVDVDALACDVVGFRDDPALVDFTEPVAVLVFGPRVV
jgi:hypothetical protein